MEEKQIIVKTQEELDNVSELYDGTICIEFGDASCNAIVRKKYINAIKVYGNRYIRGFYDSVIIAHDSSVVHAYDRSQVEAYDCTYIYALDKSQIKSYNHSNVVASYNTQVIARNFSTIFPSNKCKIEAYDYSQIITANDDYHGKVILNNNARIIKELNTTQEYLNCYKIQHTEQEAILYIPTSENKDGSYTVFECIFLGKEVCKIDKNKKIECISNKKCKIDLFDLKNAVEYGSQWDNLAILEVNANISNSELIVATMPNSYFFIDTLKTNASKIKVLREVPVKEWGLLGKFISQRRKKPSGTYKKLEDILKEPISKNHEK